MGNELFKEVTDLTGLPKSLISEELVTILGQVGTNPHAVTLEDLRKAMATYLMEVIGSLETDEAAPTIASISMPPKPDTLES